MAAPKPRKKVTKQPRQRDSNQQTTEKKPKGGGTPEISKEQVKAFLRETIEDYAKTLKREKMLDLMYMNRGLGVGNIRTFVDEFEAGYSRTGNVENGTAYGVEYTERPRLKKVSGEQATAKQNNKATGGKNNGSKK